ncbi:uncharacterized protein LOC131690963 [Topomyia yanbarensis]|uniref:uncharacterized protein LOC131690963 n=1 Tax=Topomyia yanbarensis TaxID=2498891 RepID=UPI00273B9D06|nr:uncharacterized protein LOC131690963 [Topomyia yanbarensis]
MCRHCTLCGLGPRATIVFVGIVSLLFAGGYVYFSIAGILAHNCQINMTSSPEEYGIYLYYLRSSECGKINLTHLGIQHVPENLPIDVPDVSAAAQRTYIFCIIGAVLYGLWFVTSIFMFGSVCVSCMGRCCIVAGIYPYIISLFLVLTFSVVTFVFYLIDFIGSFDIDFVLNLIEIENQAPIRHLFEQVDNIYLIVPPLLLWLIASIGVIIWFMFLLLAFVMVGVANRLWRENKPAPSYNNSRPAPRTMIPAAATIGEMREEPKPTNTNLMVAATRYNDPARQPNDSLTYNEIPPANVDVRRTVEPLKGGHEPPYETEPSPHDIYENAPRSPLRTNSMINPYTDKRFTYLPGNPQPFSYLAGPPQVSPRNSTNVPEVRSQLPWSYFHAPDQAPVQRRVTSTLTDHKEFPGEEYIPPMVKPSAPDDRSSDEGKWSGPEYRY